MSVRVVFGEGLAINSKTILRLSIYALILCALSSPALALQGSTGVNGSNAAAAGAYETGDGINIGLVSSGNVLTTHEAFNDGSGVRAFNVNIGRGITVKSHDTAVAGIAISSGSATYPNDIGVAPSANIYSTKILYTDDTEDAVDELITGPSACKVILTVVQDNVNPADGTERWTLAYDYYAYTYSDVLFANPAGNYTSRVSICGDSYNGVTTGGLIFNGTDIYTKVGSASSPGLTIDGRNKPDLAAPSELQHVPYITSDTSWANVDGAPAQGFTSYSTPHTAGVAALLHGLANDTAEANDSQNVVIKAVMVNSTFTNINDKGNNPTTSLVWNDDRGYGRLNALNAYQTLNAGKITKGITTTQQKGWGYEMLPAGVQTDTYSISGKKDQRLVLTVTWNREVTRDRNRPFDPYVYTAEADGDFDIAVSVIGPSATPFTESDELNNLVKTEIILAEDGEYQIEIAKTLTPSRGYGMAFELIDPLVADFDTIDYVVDINDLIIMATEWGQTGTELQFDLKDDDKIDYLDFAIFQQNWLNSNPRYYTAP